MTASKKLNRRWHYQERNSYEFVTINQKVGFNWQSLVIFSAPLCTTLCSVPIYHGKDNQVSTEWNVICTDFAYI